MEVFVAVTARIGNEDPVAVFERLTRFEEFSTVTQSVKEVAVGEIINGQRVSTWNVGFRNGVLKWTEQEILLPEDRRIEFELIDGDFHTLSGAWSVHQDSEAGVSVEFSCAFDMGMASLAPMVDPLAEAALKAALREISSGLYGDHVLFVDTSTAMPSSPALS